MFPDADRLHACHFDNYRFDNCGSRCVYCDVRTDALSYAPTVQHCYAAEYRYGCSSDVDGNGLMKFSQDADLASERY